MKKYVSLILALIMVFALCACSKEDSPTIDNGNPSGQTTQGSQKQNTNLAEFKGHLLEGPMTTIASGNYMYEAKSENQNDTPITYAKYGQNLLITYTVNGTPMSYIVKDGQKYIAFASEKVYAKLSEQDIQKYGISEVEATASASDFSFLASSTFAESGKVSYNDISYQYEDYYNPLTQLKYRFLFDENKNLCYMTNIDATGKQGSVVSVKIYASSASIFDVLNTYTLADLDEKTAVVTENNTESTSGNTMSEQ
ncbi:MAG: hypothetical protein PUD72_01270 [Oscillospiraceae bacterium]|nr:hypothetical protein [Oscillospiraceae bacterium]